MTSMALSVSTPQRNTDGPQFPMSPPPLNPNSTNTGPTADAIPSGTLPSRFRDAEMQTAGDLDHVHSLLRGGVLRFPLFCAILCPITVLLSGALYLMTWRVGYLQAVDTWKNKETPPLALIAQVFFLLWGLVVTYCFGIPRFVSVGISQHVGGRRASMERRSMIAQALLVHVPLMSCEFALSSNYGTYAFHLAVDDIPNKDALSMLLTVSPLLHVVAAGMMLWWIWVNFAVDVIRERVEKVANRYARDTGLHLMRRAGVRIPFRVAPRSFFRRGRATPQPQNGESTPQPATFVGEPPSVAS